MERDTSATVAAIDKAHERFAAQMEKLLAVADPNRIYGEPTAYGDYTVITASEVVAGMGSGYGVGGGQGPVPEEKTAEASEPTPGWTETEGEKEEAGGFGGGGGGGGTAFGRPVAIISIGPQGVRVEPVVDVTKLGLAFFTMAGSMFVIMRRMWSTAKRM